MDKFDDLMVAVDEYIPIAELSILMVVKYVFSTTSHGTIATGEFKRG